MLTIATDSETVQGILPRHRIPLGKSLFQFPILFTVSASARPWFIRFVVRNIVIALPFLCQSEFAYVHLFPVPERTSGGRI